MLRRLVAALAGTLLLGSVLASPAAAHDALVASDPPDGAVLDAAPEAIVLEFTGNILELNPGLEITGPDGEQVEVGEAQIDGTFVTWDVLGELEGGQYDVVWVVTSSDGHPIDGEFSFDVPGIAVHAESGTGVTEVEPSAEPLESTATAAPAPETTDPEAPTTPAPSDPADLSDNAEAWFFGGLAVTALVAVAIVLVMRRNRDPNGPPGQH